MTTRDEQTAMPARNFGEERPVPPLSVRRRLFGSAMLGLCLMGCGPSVMPPSLAHRLAGMKAPAFRELSGADAEVGLPGGSSPKVTVVDFWASWCQGCAESMPLLDELYRDKRGDGVSVIGVNVDDGPGDPYSAAQRFHATFPIVADPHLRIASAFSVSQVPLTFVVDRMGTVRWVGRDPGELRRAVEFVLAE